MKANAFIFYVDFKLSQAQFKLVRIKLCGKTKRSIF